MLILLSNTVYGYLDIWCMLLDVRISSHVNCQMSPWFTFALVVEEIFSYDSWLDKKKKTLFRLQRAENSLADL